MITRGPRLIRTPQAGRDLIEIGTYISRFSPRAADKVLDLLDLKSAALADNPYLGMTRDALGKGIRHSRRQLCHLLPYHR